MSQLLSARGHYTVFAPTNQAMAEYLVDVYQNDSTLMSSPTLKWNEILAF